MTDAKVIPLTKGYVAIISPQDYSRVTRYKWYVHQSKGTKRKHGYPYARATINNKKVYLHRFIMDAPEYLQVDHRNHCTLDNRRENLEVIDGKENLQRMRRQCDKAKKGLAAIRQIKKEVGLSLDAVTCLNRLYEVLK